MNTATRTSTTSAAELAELEALEDSLRVLLGVVDAPQASVESFADAVGAWSRIDFDPERVVAAFRGAPEHEKALARESLARLRDLDALLRDACARNLIDTATAIERTRTLRAQLQSLGDDGRDGDLLDCTH